MPILKSKPKGLLVKKVKVGKLPNKTKTANKVPARSTGAERDEWGITKGSDQSIILAEMIRGGVDKHEITERLNKVFEGKTTSGGKPKPVSTVVNQLIHSMTARGFTIESTWRLVPPADGKLKPPAPRKRPAASAKAVAKPSLNKAHPKLPAKKTAASKATSARAKLPLSKRNKAS